MSSLLDASSKILELFRIRYRYIELIENMDMSSLDSCVYWSSFLFVKDQRKRGKNAQIGMTFQNGYIGTYKLHDKDHIICSFLHDLASSLVSGP